MRVSNQSLTQQVNEGIQLTFRRLAKAQEVVASGKRINHLSDDALGASRVLDLKSYASSLDQYLSSIDNANSLLAQTDTTLAEVTNVLSRAKEIAVSLANGTHSAEDRRQGISEIHAISQQLLTLGNTKFDGRYIFAGYKNGTAPFSEGVGGVVYSGDSNEIYVPTSPSTNLQVTLPGDKVFQGATLAAGTDLFDTLSDLETALAANDVSGPDGIMTQIGRLDAGLDQVLSFRTEIGARQNSAEVAKDSLSALQLRTTELRSQLEDADPVTAYSELARQQYAFEAALQSASQVIQPSILDYLR
jgi:flagellar hook-associated protein 3 FlgL